MPKIELKVDKNKPPEAQVCEIWGSTDMAEIIERRLAQRKADPCVPALAHGGAE